MTNFEPGQTVSLTEQDETVKLADDIIPKAGTNKFSTSAVGTVLETKTFVRVIVGTTVGWVEESKLKKV